MRSSDLLLGFDARETCLPADGEWGEQRRLGHLFRLDVAKPLSVDPNVWRSVFYLYPELRPPYTGVLTGLLWEDLERLGECLRSAGVQSCDLVALALSTAACSLEEQAELDDFLTGVDADGAPVETGPLTTISTPSTVDASWQFRGYDVADLACNSSLMNMGFLPGFDNTEALRARWGPLLNAFHLFDDWSQATEFKNSSNQRVPEHAPFFVVGIWLIGALRSSSPGLVSTYT